jgi:hypothetical protein
VLSAFAKWTVIYNGKCNLWLQGCFVPEQFVPKEGMQFEEVEDAFEFYCDYAKMAGFNVRRFRKRQQVSCRGTCATEKNSVTAATLTR